MVFEGEFKKAEELAARYGIDTELLLGVTESPEEMEKLAAGYAGMMKEKQQVTDAEAEKKRILEGTHWEATMAEVEAMTMEQYARWAAAGHHLKPTGETLEEKVAREQEKEAQDYEVIRQKEAEDRERAEQARLDAEAAREAENARLEGLSIDEFYSERSKEYGRER
jgi:hypothetical protein